MRLSRTISLYERIERLRTAPVLSVVFACAAFGIALFLRLALDAELPPGFPFLTFFPAVILTAFFAGLWPGIAVAIASGLAAWYFFIPPANSFAIGPSTALALGFYLVIVTVDILLIHAMDVALRRLRQEQGKVREAEARAMELARHREVLYAELQHRISNNLQIVSALLSLQRGQVKDEKARAALNEAANRLALIARIQRRLHDATGGPVRFDRFLEELADDVMQAAGMGERVVCTIDSQDIPLAREKIIPIALIITELINNSLEHAFIGRAQGMILVEVRRDETVDEALVSVSDDGIGLMGGFNPNADTNLGLRLVRLLAKQVAGTFDIQGGRSGTTARLRFSLR
jgi:two-component system, sensor histidine kinase PdtaS